MDIISDSEELVIFKRYQKNEKPRDELETVVMRDLQIQSTARGEAIFNMNQAALVAAHQVCPTHNNC